MSRTANGNATTPTAPMIASVSHSELCTANVIASAKSSAASAHASAGANPRSRSAREMSAPGSNRQAQAAPSRSPRPAPSAGSRRARASAGTASRTSGTRLTGAAAEPPRLKVCIPSDLTANEDSIRGEGISKSGFETARRQSRHASRSASQAMQTPRAKQRSSLAGGEPARGLPIAPPALAAEEQQPQPDAGEQQPTRPLRLTRAAVLGEEVQLSADVLGEEPAAVRGAADVHHLGAGEEVDAPAGLAEAVAPVGLLGEHEEVLVEESDLARRVGPE